MNKWLLAVFILGSLSCGNNKKLGKKVVLDEVAVSANKTAMSVYRGSAARVWDITNTRVALSFNLKERTADGKAWVDLHPYFYATDTLELDAKTMKINSVALNDRGSKKELSFEHKDDILKLKFDKKYKTTDTIQLIVDYTSMPYSESTGGSKAITDDRGLYFINTDNATPGKPVQIWTQGESEANSHWMPTIDKPNERFTTRIELTVPDSFTTLSNGYLFMQTREGKNMRRDVWIMEKPIQTYANMFAIGKYAVVKDEWRGREVSYYVEPEYAPYARGMFNNTPAMMDCFSKATGVPYPWNKYSQVVARDYVSGAMENTTASLFGEFVNKNFRELADNDNDDVVSHELFHQWFGDYVTAESWSNITLNESFANYGEVIWRRCKYGKASADEHRIQQMWSYVFGGSQSPSLVRYHYGSREDVFDRVSYQKGGAILNYLNALVGDSAFSKAMSVYLTKNALQPAEASQWRLAVEEVTGQDWNWFFDQWYYRGGHPVLDMSYNYDDAKQQMTVTATQSQKYPVYTLPVTAWVINGSDKTVADWILKEKTETFTYPYKNGQRPIVLADAEHVVVGDVIYNLTPSQWLTIYKMSDDNFINKRFAIGAAGKALEDSSSQAIINLALKDSNSSVRQLTLQSLWRIKDKKWRDKWLPDVMLMASQDGSNKVRAAAFGTLSIWKEKTGKDEMLSALSESSYIVAGAALKALKAINETKSDTVYQLSKQILNNEPKGELRLAAWEVVGDKAKNEDIALFEQYAYTMYGRDKIDFAESLTDYITYVEGNDAFERGLNILTSLVKNEGIKSYRSTMAAYLFKAAIIYKEDIQTSKSNAQKGRAQKRVASIKEKVELMMKAENETENLSKYKTNMQKVFGS